MVVFINFGKAILPISKCNTSIQFNPIQSNPIQSHFSKIQQLNFQHNTVGRPIANQFGIVAAFHQLSFFFHRVTVTNELYVNEQTNSAKDKMVRLLSSFTNLCHRQIPNSYQGMASQIQNRYLTIDQTNAKSDQLMQNPDEVLGQNQTRDVSEIAKEVSNIIQTKKRWEKTLLRDFPTVNFKEPTVYNEILKQHSDTFMLLRFYSWLKCLDKSLSDPALCNMIFRKLVENGAAKAAKCFLDKNKFVPEPLHLELYITCLCENGLIDESVDVFEKLKVVGHCPSLQTWNQTLFHSVRTKRVDVVWRLYSDMTESGVVTNVTTFGHLILACCVEKNVVKGYELLQQVLQAGLVPDNIVFNKLISSLGKKGEYGKMSGVLHNMIAKNCSPDIYTYKEVINGLSSQRMQQERFRIFNELKERGHCPDRGMYTVMIRSLCQEKELESARKLWSEMIQKGIHPNEFTYSTFIHGLWKNGNFDEAEKFFDEMLAKNYVKPIRIHRTMIYGMCLHGKVNEALVVIEKMKQKGIHDSIIYSSLINGFSLEGKIVEGMHFLVELLKQGLQHSSTSFTVLIIRLCKTGHVNEAEMLWQEMRNKGLEPEICSLNRMIFGLSNNGHSEKAMEWFSYMINHGGRPWKSTSERLLQCLSEVNRLGDALSVLCSFFKMGFTLEKSACDFLVYKLRTAKM